MERTGHSCNSVCNYKRIYVDQLAIICEVLYGNNEGPFISDIPKCKGNCIEAPFGSENDAKIVC